ncbi:AAA family ATPase [Mordavella massiliensis]
MDCFGKTTHMPYFQIHFTFGEQYVRIYKSRDGYVMLQFAPGLEAQLRDLFGEVAETYRRQNTSESTSNEGLEIYDKIIMATMLKQRLRYAVTSMFLSAEEVIYIPAGRSLLATLSEDMRYLLAQNMDLTMREFVELIQTTRKRFGTKIPEMIKDYTKTENGQINNMAVGQAYSLIREILKADYTSEEDGEKIYFDERHWVKLMYGSSGQQEALWILLLVFIIILENKNAFVIIEEPEAHLFPKAQRKIVNLIALMVNTTKSKVMMTTHSPYILTAANILLYSRKVEEKPSSGTDTIVPRNLRLSYEKTAAYKVGGKDRTIVSLLDEETHMIDADYIDSVSEIINEELERLLEKECDL